MHKLQVDLQSRFEGESVSILLDGKEDFGGDSVVTNLSSQFAASGSDTTGDSSHTVSLILNGDKKWERTIKINSGVYVGLNILRVSGMRLVWSRLSA